MSLKVELESLDAVPEGLRGEYKEVTRKDPTGAEKKLFLLDLEGDLPDEYIGALKRARDHEKTQRSDIEKRLKKAREDADGQIAKLQEELDGLRSGAIPKADAEALQKSLKDRHAAREKELSDKMTEEIGKRDKTLRKILIESKAMEIAARISTSPGLMRPVIEKRLAMEEVDGEYQTRVLDADGKVSAYTIDDLEKELKATKDYAPVIIGSKASGAGANGAAGAGAGGGKPDPHAGIDWSKFDPAKATPSQLVAWSKRQEEIRQARG